MLRDVTALKSEFDDIQKEIETLEAEGCSGGSLVVIRLGFKGRILALQISPEVLAEESTSLLEDLIKAAHESARERLEELTADKMSALTGGLPFPLKL